jgi:hypothetical protein
VLRDLFLGNALGEPRGRRERIVARQKRPDPAFLQMREESQRGLGNARVAESAY